MLRPVACLGGATALLLLAVTVLRAPGGAPGAASLQQQQQQDACRHLPGKAGQLCSSYQAAAGPDKFTAAAHWRQLSAGTYACSGVNVECLQVDMRMSRGGSSSCRPLQDGAVCDAEQELTCEQGFCGGRPALVDPVDPSFEPLASGSLAAVGMRYHSSESRQPLLRRAAALAASLLTGSDVATQRQRVLQASQGVSAQVDASWPTAYGYVKAKDGGRRIPETFLATSHEWTRLTDYGGDSAGVWAEIFKVLGPSPVLRIGGATQDKLVDPPKDETWAALAKLQKLTGCRFIIGLPLFQKNAIDMSKQMIGQAKKFLGGSVIGYELGNEPEFWPAGLGGWDTNGTWASGFGPYSQWFDRAARSLNPCGTAPFLSGPGWGNVNTQDPNWLKIVLRNGNACGYLWEANTHYYPYIDNTTVTADQLLAQPLQDFGVERFKAYVKIAQEGHSLPLRISEANSLYGGGRSGLSDTMAAALWVTDALFAFAHAGARALHYHWGHGGLPFEGGSPNVGVQTNFDYNSYPYKPYPSVHAPWYGYLFWMTATAGGYNKNADTQFVAAWVERTPPAALAPPPAPPSVVTEKGATSSGNTTTTASSSSNTTTASSSGNKTAPTTGSNLRLAQGAQKPAGPAPVKESAKVPAAKAPTQQQQQQAAKAGRHLLEAKQNTAPCNANLKLWALKADDGTLRVAIFNKDSKQACNVRVAIPDSSQFCRAGQKAQLSRLLPGPEGMNSRGGLSWQGQHYEDASVATSGKLAGDKAVGSVTASTDAAGCSYIIGMPTSSAALLVLKA